jgi:hypothetical protein
MNPTRYAGLAALILALVLIAHAILAFTKLRWVTALLELIAAAVLFWHWWLRRAARTI